MLHYWPIRQFGNAIWGLNVVAGTPASNYGSRSSPECTYHRRRTPSHPVPNYPVEYENIMTTPGYQTA